MVSLRTFLAKATFASIYIQGQHAHSHILKHQLVN